MSFLLLLLLCFAPLCGEESAPLTTQEKIERFSEFIGYTLGGQFDSMNLQYDPEAVRRGLERYKAGDKKDLPSSLQSEMDLILQIQEELFEQQAAANQLRTKQFFSDLAKDSSIETLIDNELYIKKLQEGQGSTTVKSSSTPLIHYSARTFDDIPIVNTYERGSPVRLSLLETIPGFAKGIQGMRAGEKRIKDRESRRI